MLLHELRLAVQGDAPVERRALTPEITELPRGAVELAMSLGRTGYAKVVNNTIVEFEAGPLWQGLEGLVWVTCSYLYSSC